MIKFTYNERLVYQQLLQLGEHSGGIVTLSVKKIGLLLGLDEADAARCLDVLKENEVIAVAKPGAHGRPATYRVFTETEMRGRYPSNVILFAPYLGRKQRDKSRKKPQARNHDLCR
jgi:predicted ArsR family transcriptional regulator